jgi:hypothetical protein
VKEAKLTLVLDIEKSKHILQFDRYDVLLCTTLHGHFHVSCSIEYNHLVIGYMQ